GGCTVCHTAEHFVAYTGFPGPERKGVNSGRTPIRAFHQHIIHLRDLNPLGLTKQPASHVHPRDTSPISYSSFKPSVFTSAFLSR
ncbi:unnamed protein product, partial [Gulo gulo]